MEEKMTYDEWCKETSFTFTEAVKAELMDKHNIDIEKEIEQIKKSEYESYLNDN